MNLFGKIPIYQCIQTYIDMLYRSIILVQLILVRFARFPLSLVYTSPGPARLRPSKAVHTAPAPTSKSN